MASGTPLMMYLSIIFSNHIGDIAKQIPDITAADIKTQELAIMESLNFELNHVYPRVFLRLFIHTTDACVDMYSLSKYVVLISIASLDLIGVDSSRIAAGAVFIGIILL